jgi:hypothetical protein
MSEVTTEAVERVARMAANLSELMSAAAATNTDPDEGARRDKLLRSTGYHTEVAATLRALAAERDGLDALIARMHARDVAAIQQWRAVHPGNDLIWPDNMRLTAWCMGEVAKIAGERDALLKERNQWMANSRENKLIAESNLRERDAMRAAADNAARVLHKAGEQFAFYAGEHAKKNTPDADAKASTNRAWAERCFAAHAATADVLGDGTPDLPGLLSEAGTSVQD